MTRREVMSDKTKNRVGKLTYQVSGSFRITQSTDQGSYYSGRSISSATIVATL